MIFQIRANFILSTLIITLSIIDEKKLKQKITKSKLLFMYMRRHYND